MLDGEEVLLKLDPLKPDTDGNGILDGNEKIQQEVRLEISQPELPDVTRVQISYKVAGDINETIDFRSVYQGDIFASEVVGIKGIPVRVGSVSPVESAKITFGYKESMSDDEIDNLGILYREKDNGTYAMLISQLDKTNHTISAAMPSNLGVCLVVDKRQWYAAWQQELNY